MVGWKYQVHLDYPTMNQDMDARRPPTGYIRPPTYRAMVVARCSWVPTTIDSWATCPLLDIVVKAWQGHQL
jgi:hypothetical protein